MTDHDINQVSGLYGVLFWALCLAVAAGIVYMVEESNRRHRVNNAAERELHRVFMSSCILEHPEWRCKEIWRWK